jgi:succinoglycan biosynthesis transport protein ExoP
MELKTYAKVIWRWLWLIVLGVAVAATSTYLAVREQEPVYRAKATLIVGQVLEQAQLSQTDVYMSRYLAETYAEVARRGRVQEATKETLGLAWLPAYEVTNVPNTQLIEITVEDTNPEQAAAVANELARQLISQSPTDLSPEQAPRKEFVQEQLDDLEENINVTKAEIAKQQDALAGMFSAREIADTQAQIAALQQKLNSYQANYGQLLTFLGQGAVNTLSMVEEATAPINPVGSGKLRMVLLAAAVGLVLGVGTAFLLEYLDDTIKTPADIDKAMHLTTLGGISRIPGNGGNDKLITVQHPKSPISEAYRVLRTNLQFSSLDKPIKTLVITSPNPVEGKSTTIANLGVVMAQTGKSVILVDADLRRPMLHRIFGIDNRQGLTDALLGDEPLLDGHLQPTAVENLRILNTGPLPPNPSELLGSQRMARLIEQLKGEADLVLFDTPPALAVTDASVLATQTDGVLLIADAGRTRRSMAKEAVDRFRQVGANLLGVALNRLRPGRGDYYSYYYYHYYGDANRRRQRKGLARLLPRRGGRSKS